MISQNKPDENKKVQKILAWRESFTTMEDNLFFGLIRMYLGEIKTPYNKQKLIEQLSGFLRKDENKQNLIKLLSDTDLLIITAIYFMPEATQSNLSEFFPNVFSFAALYERLLNLQERLIIFNHYNENKTKKIIDINPLLEDTLQPYLHLSTLLPSAVYAEREDYIPSELTPLLLTSFLSFIISNPDVCKTDGSFKKRPLTLIEKIFSNKLPLLQYLIKACINLSLIKEQEKGFFVDFNRCEAFSALSEQSQCAYLCVASCGRFSREGFRKQAQLLLNTASSIPKEGFSESILLRSGVFLLATKQSNEKITTSRFSQMLENSRNDSAAQNQTDNKTGNPLERLLEPAILFGIFSVTGRTSAGERILNAGSRFCNQPHSQNENISDALRIDAGFSITLMPGLQFARLLPLIKFMSIVQFDSVAIFEITRKSVLFALDNNVTQNDIFSELRKNTSFELPQNLTVSIDEWSNSYSSASLYSGFILKTDESNKMLSQKNPIFAPHIKEILADGIFLLDVKTADEAQELIKKCGVDFIGRVKNIENEIPSTSFPLLSPGIPLLKSENKNISESEKKIFERGSEEDRASFFIQLRSKLTEMNLDKEQKEGLDLRIRRKIILNSEQLRPDSVRLEKNEATGMDFIGKIRIIEKAMSSGCMIEIGINKKLLPGIHDTVPPRILGTPLGIEKFDNDALVKLRIEPEQVEKTFSIGQADFIRRIRGSILQEISEKN